MSAARAAMVAVALVFVLSGCRGATPAGTEPTATGAAAAGAAAAQAATTATATPPEAVVPRCAGPYAALGAALPARLVVHTGADADAALRRAERALADAADVLGLRLALAPPARAVLRSPFRLRLDALSASHDAAGAAAVERRLKAPARTLLRELSLPGQLTIALIPALVPPDAAAAVVLREVDGLAFSHAADRISGGAGGWMATLPPAAGPVVLIDSDRLAAATPLDAARLVAHELGHALGLGHPAFASTDDVMAVGCTCLAGLSAAQRDAVRAAGELARLSAQQGRASLRAPADAADRADHADLARPAAEAAPKAQEQR